MARKKPTSTDLTVQSVALAEYAAKTLVAAEELGVKKKPIQDFPLDDAERFVVADLPSLSASGRKKLTTRTGAITVADLACFVLAVSESILDGEPLQRLRLLFIARKLTDCLQASLVSDATKKPRAVKSKPAKQVYQFKIILMGIKPKVWRRIQIQDCTLDKLHEHIQTAMGWTNSHLHQFEIKGERYGDPALMDDGFDGFACIDSTKTYLSHVLPGTDKRFAFRYEYDFGDSWQHKILFEGTPPVDLKAKYPLCMEGERACPPEDCGGVWGYGDFLKAIRNPKHEEHDSMLEWVGGRFDSEYFDAKEATAAMRELAE